MKRILFAILIAFMVLSPLSGCFTHKHTFGSGAVVKSEPEFKVQWYVGLGFVPIGDEIDGGKLAKTKDCVITSKYDWLDVIMNITIPGFMGLGATRRTIIIER